MAQSLQAAASTASDARAALERAFGDSRSQWNDSTRQAFDRNHGETIAASARKVAEELTSLSSELAAMLATLR